MNRIRALMALVAASAMLGGCAYNVGYNSTYLPPQGAITKIDAPVVIVMSKADQDWTFSGHPTSFTGGGTTLTIPLGNITKQIALDVFSAHFSSTRLTRTLPRDGSYRLAINPHISHFDYAYNQLKNLGFAITPEIHLDLEVKLFDTTGKQLMDKTYTSGLRSGETYLVSGSPQETINKTVHRTLFELMEKAAGDAAERLADLPPAK